MISVRCTSGFSQTERSVERPTTRPGARIVPLLLVLEAALPSRLVSVRNSSLNATQLVGVGCLADSRAEPLCQGVASRTCTASSQLSQPLTSADRRPYITALRKLAPRYGFGFVDGWHKVGRRFWPGVQAAAYLSSTSPAGAAGDGDHGERSSRRLAATPRVRQS
jgi:hypothetical protein